MKTSESRKTMKNVKVYIASPYTKGDCAKNVRVQIDCWDELTNLGFYPFAPLYSHFQHMVHPRPFEDWIRTDKVWVETCDCLLRLPGVSTGGDIEVEHARSFGKPVFYSVQDLVNFYTF